MWFMGLIKKMWFMECWGTHAVDANAETFNISPSGIQSLIGVIYMKFFHDNELSKLCNDFS